MRVCLTLVALIVALISSPHSVAANPTTGTFTLDALSFISFGDDEVLLLPSGSTIVFQFGNPAPDGSVPFTIAPSGVSIAPVPVSGSSTTLDYALAGTSTGSLTTTPTGRALAFTATVKATLSGSSGGAFNYTMPFTTETASAQSADGNESETVTGLRLVDGAWYGQIVGATTNHTNAFPAPGTAVYTVLSGSFDQIPAGQ